MDNNSLMIYEFIPLLLTFQNSKKLFFVTTPRNSILSSDKYAVLANFDKIPEFRYFEFWPWLILNIMIHRWTWAQQQFLNASDLRDRLIAHWLIIASEIASM